MNVEKLLNKNHVMWVMCLHPAAKQIKNASPALKQEVLERKI